MPRMIMDGLENVKGGDRGAATIRAISLFTLPGVGPWRPASAGWSIVVDEENTLTADARSRHRCDDQYVTGLDYPSRLDHNACSDVTGGGWAQH